MSANGIVEISDVNSILDALVPLLDGNRLLEDLYAKFSARDKPRVKKLIEKLVEHGIILDRSAPHRTCLLYTSPSPRDKRQSRMPSSA